MSSDVLSRGWVSLVVRRLRDEHPALMETAVVFDDVPMDVEEGAVFENPFAMIWCDGDDAAEALNGKTGTFFAKTRARLRRPRRRCTSCI